MARIYQGGDTLGARVVVMPSVNMEVTGTDGCLPHHDGIVPGKKQQVHTIVKFPGDDPNQLGFRVKMTGERDEVPVSGYITNPSYLTAGGAVNVAFVLRLLGYESVCVAGPVGSGRDGMSVAQSLEHRGVRSLLWEGRGTRLTLTLRNHNGESTLLCEQPQYNTDQRLLDMLRECTFPRIVVAAGVKPMDLEVVEAMFGRRDVEVRIFAPHETLLEAADLRSRVAALAAQADLMQINDIEAKAFLGRPCFEPRMVREVASLGAETTVVTMGKRGAVAAVRGRSRHILQGVIHVDHPQDTSGLGDAHLAVLVYCMWIRSIGRPSLTHCLRAAAWVAARKLGKIGPTSGIPTVQELETRLKRWHRKDGKRK